MRILVTLLVAIALYALVAIRLEPPEPRNERGSGSTFCAQRAYEILESLLADELPHSMASPANAAVRGRLLEQLEGFGYEPKIQSAFAYADRRGQLKVHNVIATLPGSSPDGTILLNAHYDSVPSGPGASDDGVAVAALLEVARIARASPRLRNTVVFLFDDGEEMGLCGAKAFCREHPLCDAVDLVINFEARGTSGSSLMFETSGENAWLVNAFARACSRPVTGSVFTTIYEALPNDTNLTAYKKAGIPGLNFAFIGDPQNYHTTNDDLAHVTLGSVQHHGDNALELVRSLGDADLETQRATNRGDAVFFDVLCAFVVWWPAHLSQPIALALLVMTVLFALKAARKAGWRSLFRASTCFVGGVAFPPALCFGGAFILTQMGVIDRNLVGQTTGYSAVYWVLSLVGLWLATRFSKVQVDAWSLWTVSWLTYGVLALAASSLAVGTSYLFIVPLLIAVLSAFRDAVSGRQPGFGMTILPVIAAGIVWFPLHQLVPVALGVRQGWIIGACNALFLITALTATANIAPTTLKRR